MPQLDRYLVFSEIFWFVLFFSLSYFVVYYLLVLLSKGLRIRAALESHHLLQTLHLKSEKTLLSTLANLTLEQQILELGRLARWFSVVRGLVRRTALQPQIELEVDRLPAPLNAARLLLIVGEPKE